MEVYEEWESRATSTYNQPNELGFDLTKGFRVVEILFVNAYVHQPFVLTSDGTLLQPPDKDGASSRRLLDKKIALGNIYL